MSAILKVIQPGLQTTVQDQGRVGYQKQGIPVSGPLDRLALAAANVVVGNAPGTAGLEMALMGPTLEVEAGSVRVAVAGGRAELQVISPDGDARVVTGLQSARVLKGERIRVGAISGTSVAYLALEGGIDVPLFLGSRSTYVRGGFGGLEGRALKDGDRVEIAQTEAPERSEYTLEGVGLLPATEIRVVLGPQHEDFTEDAITTLLSTEYVVTRDADRMGLRLDGAKLPHTKSHNIVSDGIAPGAIQVPGNGMPIVLLADRQSTGGYPKIATVISADLPGLGRVSPGARLRFSSVDIKTAEAARRDLESLIASLPSRLTAVRGAGPDLDRLLSSNLVSGVVDAMTGEPVV